MIHFTYLLDQIQRHIVRYLSIRKVEDLVNFVVIFKQRLLHIQVIYKSIFYGGGKVIEFWLYLKGNGTKCENECAKGPKCGSEVFTTGKIRVANYRDGER